MSTIKYLLQSKSTSAPIYLRLSLGRQKVIKRKTGLICDASKWNSAKGQPIGSDANSKRTKKSLRDLKGFILDKYDNDYANGLSIDGDWLSVAIADYFDRSPKKELDGFVEYGEHYIKELKYKVNKENKKGVSVATQKKYRTIVNKVIAFEKHRKKKVLIRDVNLKLRSEIIDYFSEIDKLSDNTIGRYLKFIKSICLDARRNDIKTHKQLEHFKGFTVKAPKVTLSFEELEKIKRTELFDDNLKTARDWLIIGCYTGQRISDLMRMNPGFIENIRNFNFIVLDQVKTGKTVQIPIHHEVKAILDKRNGEFPPLFAKSVESHKTMFNRYLKSLCKKCEINSIVEGSVFNKKEQRYLKADYEKYKVVASHICRRSFATNFYGHRSYPTPLLMNITAHSTEEMFLEYIGKKPIDYGIQLAKIWAKESAKENAKTNNLDAEMKLLKNASNL